MYETGHSNRKMLYLLGLLLLFVNVCYAENVYNATFVEKLMKSNKLSNSTCVADITEVAKAILRQEVWALKMLDASSKLQSGLAEGNIVNLGSYDECINIKHDLSSENRIEGKYCFSIWLFSNIHLSNIIKYAPPLSILSNRLKQFNGIPMVESICVPNSCTAEDLDELYTINGIKETFSIIKPMFEEELCQPNKNIRPFSYLEWFTVLLLLGTLFCMLFCTTYELYIIYAENRPYHNILLSFSLYSNVKKLIEVRRDPDQIPCINGLRTLSMMWIVLGHRYLISAALPHMNYLYIMNTWLEQNSSSIIEGATVSVDTFFVISGILVIYVVLLTKSKGFAINLCHYYIHRIFRLTPALCMVVLVYMTLLRYLGSGPFWPIVRNILEEPCWRNWWKTLLFLQNTQSFKDICVTQTWYLAVDTQLYILAPFIFLPIRRWSATTICALIILTGVSCYLGFISAWKSHASAAVTSVIISFQNIYSATHVRMNSWLVGALLGYFLYKKRGQTLHINKVLVVFLWIISLACMFIIVFSNAYFFKYPYNRIVSSVYIGFSRAIWSISICWIIFACVHGYGGYINKFLSMRIFIVTGRLTYSIYLLHSGIMFVIAGQAQVADHFSNMNTIYLFCADLSCVFIIATIWTLAFESPIIAIGKILMPREMAEKLEKMHENGESAENNNTTSTYL